MRLGLLADIHGNTDALVRVLDEARRVGVRRILCAGDLVGYYYDAHRCLELLAEWDVECVRGNHEDMLEQSRNGRHWRMIFVADTAAGFPKPWIT